MQQFSPDFVKQSLLSLVDVLFHRRDEFLLAPEKSFTRTKKISFEQTFLFPMLAGSDNIDAELMDFFPEKQMPSPSAMIQRRNQISSSAYAELFRLFTQSIPRSKDFHGYRLAAIDGSRINLPYNPSDTDTYLQCIKGRKGINQLHLNALYDLCNEIFLDVELQSIHTMNEIEAFCSILDRNKDSSQKIIYIADRGYASYNVFAHAIKNDQLFLIRVPETFAKTICTNNDHLLDPDQVDKEILIHVGRSKVKTNLSLENYHLIPARGHYDFIEARSTETDAFHLRVLKFPITENSFEYIVTNLPQYAFSISTIQELYRIRWGIETAFRHLKYAANMVRIHSLKKELLYQEIYAKLTLYNFSSAITAYADVIVSKATEKYKYVVNRTKVIKTCIRFLRGQVSNVMDLISKNLVPVRPGRSFQRKLRSQSADTLAYR